MHYFKIQENIDSELKANIQNGKRKVLKYIEYSMLFFNICGLRREYKENQGIIKRSYEAVNGLVYINAVFSFPSNMSMREYPIALPYWEHYVIGVVMD